MYLFQARPLLTFWKRESMVPGARELSLRNLDLGLSTTETISVKPELHYLELSQRPQKGVFALPLKDPNSLRWGTDGAPLAVQLQPAVNGHHDP